MISGKNRVGEYEIPGSMGMKFQIRQGNTKDDLKKNLKEVSESARLISVGRVFKVEGTASARALRYVSDMLKEQ